MVLRYFYSGEVFENGQLRKKVDGNITFRIVKRNNLSIVRIKKLICEARNINTNQFVLTSLNNIR